MNKENIIFSNLVLFYILNKTQATKCFFQFSLNSNQLLS